MGSKSENVAYVVQSDFCWPTLDKDEMELLRSSLGQDLMVCQDRRLDRPIFAHVKKRFGNPSETNGETKTNCQPALPFPDAVACHVFRLICFRTIRRICMYMLYMLYII